MAKSKKYIIKYSGRSVEMSKANSSTLIYRIPYQNLSGNTESVKIDNSFIVYILFGKNEKGKDAIYVGKSKNGLKNRPIAHEDKFSGWTVCYVLTQFKERTFFNDGTIQYLENRLNRIVSDLGFYDNTTRLTTSGTANASDEEDCEEYLEEAIQMLDALGLDLITYKDEIDEDISEMDNKNDGLVPDGIYILKRKIKRANRTYEAKMQVAGGKYIVLKGSEICDKVGPGLADNILEARDSANIVDEILLSDVTFDTPSGACQFVIGAAGNGWANWKCEDGSSIDKYRN
ncbi:hypothetical protein [uncultured Eubacterium sp.]|uniref:hypothetical protein n=1 Tax=uncultured Eubacterium sp. TaxID=165185 RepID=UPI00259818E0|nr:hypothetical protein [uncultured Eubacterium sp.]